MKDKQSFNFISIKKGNSKEKAFEIFAIITNILFAIISIPLLAFEIYGIFFILIDKIPKLVLILLSIGFLLKYPFFIFQWILILLYKGNKKIKKEDKTIFSILLIAIIIVYSIFTFSLWVELATIYRGEILKILLNPYVVTVYLYIMSAFSTFLFIYNKPTLSDIKLNYGSMEINP